jgi:hypothetical protein
MPGHGEVLAFPGAGFAGRVNKRPKPRENRSVRCSMRGKLGVPAKGRRAHNRALAVVRRKDARSEVAVRVFRHGLR